MSIFQTVTLSYADSIIFTADKDKIKKITEYSFATTRIDQSGRDS